MQIDRYSSPEALASAANAPLVVCQLIFVITEGDRENIRLIRSGHDVLDSETIRQRSAVSWAARSGTHSSFPQIGRALNLDHSAVLRGYNRAKLLRRTDREFRHMTDQLAAALKTKNRVQRSALAA
jgi:hypothetical protein